MADNKTSIIITAEDKASAAIKNVGNALDSLIAPARLANSVLSSLGVGVAVTGLAAIVKSAIDAGDAINDMSVRTGISVRNLAEWKLAMDQNGSSLEAMAVGMRNLSVYMVKNGEALKAAGITAKDTRGAFLQLADLFQAMPEGPERAALAVEIFKKSADSLLPVLLKGSTELEKSAKASKDYAEALSRLAPKADEFNDSMSKVWLNLEATGINILNQYMGDLVSLSERFVEATQSGTGLKKLFDDLAAQSGSYLSIFAVASKAVDLAYLMGYGGNEAGRSASGKIGPKVPALPGGNSVAETEALIRAQKLLSESQNKSTKALKEYDAQGEMHKQLLKDLADEEKQRLERAKWAAQAADEAIDAEETQRLAIEKSIGGLREKIESMERETALLGLSADARERTIMLLALEGEKASLTADAYDQLKGRIEEALAASSAKRTAIEAAEASAKAWEKFSDDIERSLTDALMRSFESGDDFAEAFVKNLQNILKTTVLKIAVQAVVDPITGGIKSLLGGDVSGGGASLINSASTASSLWSAYSGGTTALAGNVATGLGFTELGAGIKLAGTGLGTEAGGMYALGESIGTAIPYIGAAVAALALISTQLTGGTPHIGGAAFSDSNTDFNATAGRAPTESFFGNNSFQGTDWWKSPEISTALEPVAAAFADTLNSVRNRYGLSDAQVGFGFSADGEDPSRGVALAQAGTGNPLLAVYERFDVDAQRGMAEFSANLSEYMITALAASDLSDPINTYLDKFTGTISEGAANAVAAALASDWFDPFIEQLDVTALSFDQITSEILRFQEVATLKPLFDAMSLDIYALGTDLADAFGGAQNAATAMGAYYDAFYTEAEKTDALTAQVADAFADLNLAMPDSREGFRAIVEGLDLTTQAGINTYTSLLNLAPAFSTLTDAIDQTASAIVDANGDMAAGRLSSGKTWATTYSSSDPNTPTGRTMVDLVLSDEALQRAAEKEGARLVQAIFNRLPVGASAGGYSVPYRDPGAPLYSASGIELLNLGYTNEAMALSKLLADSPDYAGNTAYRDHKNATSADTLNQSIDGVAASSQWQDQLDVLNGTRTQSEVDLANALLDADDATAALIEQVYALTAAQEAERLSAETAERIANERYSLENTLLQLQGDTAALRARDLALLDASNTALQEQIWALEDQQEAADAAAQAAEELASAWESITDSLLNQIEQIRGTMAEESVDSVAALQARFAITTAQARAGDQTAAENLAEYAAQLSANITADNTGSQIEMMLAQARIAESLQATADILSGGTINPVISPLPISDSNAAVAQSVTDLKAEIVILHQRLAEIQTNTRRTADACNGNPDQPIPVETV